MSDTLTYVYATGSITKVEVAAPEVVGQQELDFKVPGFANGRGYPEVWARSEQACQVGGKRPIGEVDRGSG